MKKILIAVDEGPSAEKIAQSAFELAQQLHAEIALLSVVDTKLLITEGDITAREMADMLKVEFKKLHRLLGEKIFENKNIWSFIEEGKPSDAILKIADQWETDLIVMGTHGRTGLSRLFMGSVAETVIRQSTKPIFIIPAS